MDGDSVAQAYECIGMVLPTPILILRNNHTELTCVGASAHLMTYFIIQ